MSATVPTGGISFVINNLNFHLGVISDAFGDTVVLAKEKAIGANQYDWVNQTQLFTEENPTDAELYQRFQTALEKVNTYLAREFPSGGVLNPVTAKEKFNAWIAGYRFDSTTNQIVKK